MSSQITGLSREASIDTWWRNQMETFSVSLAFVRGIHRWPVNSPHKGQWHRAMMLSLICAWRNCWVNNRDASDLRCYGTHYDITVMKSHTVCILSDFTFSTITKKIIRWQYDSGWKYHSINTLRPRQNSNNFAEDIFKCIFCNENVWILIKISLKFVPKGPIDT